MASQMVSERAFHKTVAQYLNYALPKDAWWTTIPAGGGGLIRGVHLKAMGYKAGTPDILIIWRGEVYWIELKADGGRLSRSQSDTSQSLRVAGCKAVMVVSNFGTLVGCLELWRMITLR